MRPDRAWVSRGMIGIGVFVVFGSAYVLLHTGVFNWHIGDPGGAAGGQFQAIRIIAVLAALVVMLYHGFAISHSTAISLWSTGLMPIVSVSYAFLGGAVITRALSSGTMGGAAETLPSLQVLCLLLLASNALVLFSLMYGALNGPPGARVSMNLLLKGPYAKLFVPLVIGIGLALPAIMLLWVPASTMTSLIVTGAVLVGYYAFRTYIFKAGVYDPIMSFAPS